MIKIIKEYEKLERISSFLKRKNFSIDAKLPESFYFFLSNFL